MSPDTVQNSISRALADLAAERAHLDGAIASLERSVRDLSGVLRRLEHDAVPRRADQSRPARRRPSWSPAARSAAARRMRELWAARRKAKAKAKPKAKPGRHATKKA